jgi:hypothetical protein
MKLVKRESVAEKRNIFLSDSDKWIHNLNKTRPH